LYSGTPTNPPSAPAPIALLFSLPLFLLPPLHLALAFLHLSLRISAARACPSRPSMRASAIESSTTCRDCSHPPHIRAHARTNAHGIHARVCAGERVLCCVMFSCVTRKQKMLCCRGAWKGVEKGVGQRG